MRCSIEPKDRIYIQGYGFLSLPKNMGKNLSSKYSQKRLDSAKKSIKDAIKTPSERAIQNQQKLVLIGNKITTVSKKPSTCSQNNEANVESEAKKERYIYPEKNIKLLMN